MTFRPGCRERRLAKLRARFGDVPLVVRLIDLGDASADGAAQPVGSAVEPRRRGVLARLHCEIAELLEPVGDGGLLCRLERRREALSIELLRPSVVPERSGEFP